MILLCDLRSQPVLLEASIERAAAQAQRFSSAVRVAFETRKRFLNQQAFRVLETPVLLEASIERAAAQAQRFSSAVRVAFETRKRFLNQQAFRVLETHLFKPRGETRIGRR